MKRAMFGAVVGVAGLALVLSACGSDKNGSATDTTLRVACAPGSITGGGSTFVQTIAQQWIKDFDAACPGATVDYKAIGSSGGIQQLTAGTIDFAASDVVLQPSERAALEAKYGSVLQIPWSAGGIALEYNVKGVSGLRLSPSTLAGIFAGTITKWDGPEIKADNPGTTLPATTIQVIHRSDGSGTTAAFTAYMTATAPSVWTVGSAKDVRWPVGQGVKGSDGVTAVVKTTDGAIGYAEDSYAKANTLGVAAIKNTAGVFTTPEVAAVNASLLASAVPSDLQVAINYRAPDAAAYPISTVTYVIAPVHFADATKAKVAQAFVTYALTSGQNSAKGLYYSPLPANIATPAQAAATGIGASSAAVTSTTSGT